MLQKFREYEDLIRDLQLAFKSHADPTQYCPSELGWVKQLQPHQLLGFMTALRDTQTSLESLLAREPDTEVLLDYVIASIKSKVAWLKFEALLYPRKIEVRDA